MWPFSPSAKSLASDKNKEGISAEEVLRRAYQLVQERRNGALVRFAKPVYVVTASWYDEHRSNVQHLPYAEIVVLDLLGKRWGLTFASERLSSNSFVSDLSALDFGEPVGKRIPVKDLEAAVERSRYFRNSVARIDSYGQIVTSARMLKALDGRLYTCIASAPVIDQDFMLALIKEPQRYKPSAVEVVANALETVLIDCSLRPIPPETE